MGSAPPGWPAGLPGPLEPSFPDAAVRWLLDAGPGELRTSELRRHPRALGAHVARTVEAELDAVRASYARARTELGLAAAETEAVQRALEAEGGRLLTLSRQARLVADALLDPH